MTHCSPQQRLRALNTDAYNGTEAHIELAKNMGLNEKHASELLNGDRPLCSDFLTRLQQEQSISIDWLLTGMGYPYVPSKERVKPSEPTLEETLEGLPVDDQRIIIEMAKLPSMLNSISLEDPDRLKTKIQSILTAIKNRHLFGRNLNDAELPYVKRFVGGPLGMYMVIHGFKTDEFDHVLPEWS